LNVWVKGCRWAESKVVVGSGSSGSGLATVLGAAAALPVGRAGGGDDIARKGPCLHDHRLCDRIDR
jgi:hypothetical protein